MALAEIGDFESRGPANPKDRKSGPGNGVPYAAPELMNMGEITGGTPYGATTLAGHDGSRQPSTNELAIARFQGKHVAGIAQKLKG